MKALVLLVNISISISLSVCENGIGRKYLGFGITEKEDSINMGR